MIIIAIDVSKHPQKMIPIMNIVWPLTGLYFPIVGMCTYYKLGRGSGNMKIDHNSIQAGHMGHHDHDHIHDNQKNMSHQAYESPHHEHMEHHGHGTNLFGKVFLYQPHKHAM